MSTVTDAVVRGAAPWACGTPPVTALVAAVDGLAALLPAAGARLEGRAATDALVQVLVAAGRLQAVAASLVPAVEADGWWALGGARSLTSWLAGAARVPWAKAQTTVMLGRAFATDLPLTAEGAVSGAVPVDNAVTVARLATSSAVRRAALSGSAEECGEPFLVAQATRLVPESFTRLARRWAVAADPEADERGYRDAVDREFLTLSSTTSGVHLAGFLTAEHGATLGTALTSLMGTPARGDSRTTTQRRAQALADLSRVALDHGLVGTGSGGRVRPQVTCVVDYDTLSALAADEAATSGPASAQDAGCVEDASRAPSRRAGVAGRRLRAVSDEERFAVAEIIGAGPVPAHVLARLTCDGQVGRLVFGPSSELIDVGRAERRFTAARRRAIVARDQTCRFPLCTAPPALGELHHVVPWGEGGSTDANAGILLCYHHHDVVHRLRLRIDARPAGGWQFRHRDGRALDRGSPPGWSDPSGPGGRQGARSSPASAPGYSR